MLKTRFLFFENSDYGSIRIHIGRDENPWFVAGDICQILGLSNISEALRSLDDDEKITLRNSEGNPRFGIPHQLTVISESGFYQLIFRSHKPQAKNFSKWVRTKVLPEIRKTGHYGLPHTKPDALRALAAEIEMREAVEAQLALTEKQRDEAIRTKVEIGSRREATAMATASAAVKKIGILEDTLGIGENYKMVKAIPWLEDFFEVSTVMYQQVGKKLSQLSRRLHIKPKRIQTLEYPQGLNAYHIKVIEAFKDALERDLNMLRRYRRCCR